MMNRNIARFACLSGMVLASALLAASAEAHECRILGQANDFTPPAPGSYFICTGFAIEDESLGQPGEGKKNNLDFFPLFVTGPNEEDFIPLDRRQGDIVDVKAKLEYLNGTYYEIPVDQNYNVTPSTFFLTTDGVGYESPIATCSPWYPGCKSFEKVLNYLVPVDVPEEGAVSYRAPYDFVLPYPGMYAWVISGKLKKQGQKAVEFKTKWVSASPRLPYGPLDADAVNPATFVGEPEGWFDSVRPADHDHMAKSQAAGPGKKKRGSPDFRAVLKRLLAKK
ncbi:MAG TPA: hypothetical protein VFG05_01760 [Methylocella sp.]|nr:hypothetical protein [Methylocella sp.]